MRPEGTGTVISGEFAVHPFVRVFMRIWFGGVILIGGTVFVSAVGAILFGAASQGDAWVGVLVPPGMAVFGFFLIRAGRYLARNEARFITDFLINALDATDRNG